MQSYNGAAVGHRCKIAATVCRKFLTGLDSINFINFINFIFWMFWILIFFSFMDKTFSGPPEFRSFLP
eukprot:Skav229446  [mRNA]  locus=scaffold397:230482:230685:- [translate_table: standard]